ncbi:hypothetical protein SARC_09280 [Sphaeroforma arctica JP610]|uniref:Uncharacterized protein n=1 Tax=Sphaeroforma arctica JP610 TaxID=667725 RepID=A0A0L0FNC2_9EUKA|nr:hypothetical protein SARC_09280 [Sphaeroforma arctica JP610]KNC78287.1 hypothetical protein SARC_09280 [Sphaeroforma arctica JP610]|eukprot:XP_014152189.1 hypothetical protein SARC_09280 [Sphaeroforma arctica JP610]
MVLRKNKSSDASKERRQSMTGVSGLNFKKSASVANKNIDNGEEVYLNPTTTQLVESRYPVIRAYVVDENAVVYEYAQVKGKNAQVVIVFTELGLAIYPAKLKKKSKAELDKVDPQSFYPYSEMRGINHCRGKKGNYLSVKSADGETCAFFSKETDDIKTSLVAYIRSCSDMLFGTYDNNYTPGKQGIPLDDPLHPNAVPPPINPNMAPQYFPPGDPERQGFNDAQRRSFIAQSRQGFSDAQRRSFNNKNVSRITLKKETITNPPSMPSMRRASAIFGSMDMLPMPNTNAPMPAGGPVSIINPDTMYTRKAKNYNNRRSIGSMDEISQVNRGMAPMYNARNNGFSHGIGGRSMDNFSRANNMGGPVPMGGVMQGNRMGSGNTTPEYMSQNAFDYNQGGYNNQSNAQGFNRSKPLGTFGGLAQGAPMNRQSVRKPISNGMSRATMVNRQPDPQQQQQRQLRCLSMDAMQANVTSDQSGLAPGVRVGGAPARRMPSNQSQQTRQISPRDTYLQDFGLSSGDPQQPKMQVPAQHRSKAPSPAPRPAPNTAYKRTNTNPGTGEPVYGEPQNVQHANRGTPRGADHEGTMNFDNMKGALNEDGNSHNPFYDDQGIAGHDDAFNSKYSAMKTASGPQTDPFTAF